MNNIKNLLDWTNSRKLLRNSLLLAVTVFIIFDLFLVVLFIGKIRFSEAKFRHEADVNKVIGIMHLMEQTPPQLRQSALTAIQTPALKLSITDKAKYSVSFNQSAVFEIYNTLISDNSQFIRASYWLPKSQQWLNINLNREPALHSYAFIVIIIEIMTALIILSYAWSVHRFHNL